MRYSLSTSSTTSHLRFLVYGTFLIMALISVTEASAKRQVRYFLRNHGDTFTNRFLAKKGRKMTRAEVRPKGDQDDESPVEETDSEVSIVPIPRSAPSSKKKKPPAPPPPDDDNTPITFEDTGTKLEDEDPTIPEEIEEEEDKKAAAPTPKKKKGGKKKGHRKPAYAKKKESSDRKKRSLSSSSSSNPHPRFIRSPQQAAVEELHNEKRVKSTDGSLSGGPLPAALSRMKLDAPALEKDEDFSGSAR